MREASPEDVIPGALEKYTHDLTTLARQGQFAPLQRREQEVARVFQVLARRIRNNPMLIGEDSAERFAIVAEVVRRISIGDMPEGLNISRVVALDLEKLSADAQTPHEFEKLLRAIVAELICTERQTLLVIDKMEELFSNRWIPGTDKAANIVMFALARGQIVLLSTITSDGYNTYMMINAARYRKCQEIIVRTLSE